MASLLRSCFVLWHAYKLWRFLSTPPEAIPAWPLFQL